MVGFETDWFSVVPIGFVFFADSLCFSRFFLCFFGLYFDVHVIVFSLVALTWLSRISILISFSQRVKIKVFLKHSIEECLNLPSVKTLCEKLIKIDILLSHFFKS
jgi:hypothetical protein